MSSEKSFGAFISYSHKADAELAVSLRRGLHQLAKPWYRKRAMKVFLDNASLNTSPALWNSLCACLERSEKLILLCSPEAAASPWIAKEVEHFLSNSTVDSILPVLTSGELVWDTGNSDLDMELSSAASPALKGLFAQEPRYLDLRWIGASGDSHTSSLRNPRFLEAVADLAAPIRGIPKDELVGEDITQHRRTRLITRIAAATLSILLLASVVAGLTARNNAIRANRNALRAEQRRIEAEARRLASDASRLEGPGDLAFLLAASAYGLDPTVPIVDTLFEVADNYPLLESVVHTDSPVLAFDRNPATGDLIVGTLSSPGDTGDTVAGDTGTGAGTGTGTGAGLEADPSTPRRSRISLLDERGKQLTTPTEVDGLVRKISFLQGRIAVATTTRLAILDPKTLEVVGEFESPDGVFVAVTLSPAAGGMIVGSSDTETYVLRTEDSEPVQLLGDGEIATATAVTESGDVVAMTFKSGESMFDVTRFARNIDGSWSEKWRTPALRIATTMAVDEGTGKVFLGSASGDVAVFDLSTGRRSFVYTNTIDSRITAMAVNGTLLGLADGVGRVWVRSIADESVEFFWQAHQGSISALIGESTGDDRTTRFASAGTDGSIVVHSTSPTYPFTTRLELPAQATSVRVAQELKEIWVGTPAGVLYRPIDTSGSPVDANRPWSELQTGAVASAIEPLSDGLVAVGDYRGRIQVIRAGKVVSTVSTGSDTVFALAWSPALRQLYAITSTNNLATFSLNGTTLVPGRSLSTDATGQLIAISGNGRRVAYITTSGVEVVDAGSGAVLRTFPISFENYAEAFALDTTGEVLALGNVGSVQVREVGSAKLLAETPLVSDPVSISYAPAEPGLASGELLLAVLRDHSVVRIQASTGRLAGRIRTTDLAAVDATSEDLQWVADTSGGISGVVTANERFVYITDAGVGSVLTKSCARFARALTVTERARYSVAENGACRG